MKCFSSESPVEPFILTRIYIQENGDLVVTDLWEEILEVVGNATPVLANEVKGEMDQSL